MKQRLVTMVGILMLLGGGCSTASTKSGPPDLFEAERAVHEAKVGPAGRTLPKTLARASKTLDEARVMLRKSKVHGLSEPVRERYLEESVAKANEAEQLAKQAQDLGFKIAAWDGRIETYAEDRTVDMLMQLFNMEGGDDAEQPGAAGQRAPDGSEGEPRGDPLTLPQPLMPQQDGGQPLQRVLDRSSVRI